MGKQDYGPLPERNLQLSELELHGPPLHLAEGLVGGQHQQDGVRSWGTQVQTPEELPGDRVLNGRVGGPTWGVDHSHLLDHTTTEKSGDALLQGRNRSVKDLVFACSPWTIPVFLLLLVVFLPKTCLSRMLFPTELFPLCFSPSNRRTSWVRDGSGTSKHDLCLHSNRCSQWSTESFKELTTEAGHGEAVGTELNSVYVLCDVTFVFNVIYVASSCWFQSSERDVPEKWQQSIKQGAPEGGEKNFTLFVTW